MSSRADADPVHAVTVDAAGTRLQPSVGPERAPENFLEVPTRRPDQRNPLDQKTETRAPTG